MGDITLAAPRAGWRYVAVLLALCSRRVIGWAMREKPDQQGTLEALAMAVRQRRGSPGRIHHSDRGAQYTCGSYQQPYPAPLEIETTPTTWS
ncbi:MAG: DDE-type integrase/transposase/recombinase [Nitrospira sp.]|nr:DDE-type integrase/transposase/recombinase [Nitrospira sp.]